MVSGKWILIGTVWKRSGKDELCNPLGAAVERVCITHRILFFLPQASLVNCIIWPLSFNRLISEKKSTFRATRRSFQCKRAQGIFIFQGSAGNSLECAHQNITKECRSQSKCRFSSRFPSHMMSGLLWRKTTAQHLCSKSLEKGCIREQHNSPEHTPIFYSAVGGNFLQLWIALHYKFGSIGNLPQQTQPNATQKKSLIRSIKADNNYTHDFVLLSQCHHHSFEVGEQNPLGKWCGFGTAESAFKSDYASIK